MSEKIQVMRKLSDWLKQYGWNIYFNQKNSDAYPIFQANTNSKPDLLIQKNKYNVLIEVKTGQDHQDILNGMDQTWKYAGEYYSGRVNYIVNNQKTPIHAFVLATSHSPHGYLYASEASLNYLSYGYLKDTYNMTEKPITHSLIRFLWRQWEKGLIFQYFEELRCNFADPSINLPNKPKIGVLIAKTQNSPLQVSHTPYLYLNSNIFWQTTLTPQENNQEIIEAIT